MELVFDIEADGFYHEVTKIHCIVIKEKESEKTFTYFDGDIRSTSSPKSGSLSDAISHLSGEGNVLIGHNIIDYDIPVIQKFYPEFKVRIENVRDTLVRSYLSNPHRQKHPKCPISKVVNGKRKPIGEHSLENFGYIVGKGKVQHEDWSTLSKEMVHRCVEDVHITDLVDDYLTQEMGKWDWTLSEWIEKKFRWILSEQERHGWLFDSDKARTLISNLEVRMKEIEDEVIPRIPPVFSSDKKTCKQIKTKAGGYHTNFVKWFESCGIGPMFDMSSFSGEYSRVDCTKINLNSDKQVKKYLLSVGWIPTEWNYKKNGKRIVKDKDGLPVKLSPKLTEDSFESLQDDTGKLVAEFMKCSHRKSQIQGWIDNVRKDGRIGAGGISNATNTGRVAHRVVVNVPKADEGVFYGREMRSLFCVPPGYKQVGDDLCALEDRCAGHFTYKYDNGAYANLLLKSDPHQRTADIFNCSRFVGKTCNHALKFGASFKKLMILLNVDEVKARILHSKWWKKHPSLHKVRESLEDALKRRKQLSGNSLTGGAYIKGIDGRKIFVRSKHSLLNALIQNAGSVVNKLTTIYIYDMIQEQWLDAHMVGNFHDERQAEVAEADVEAYRKITEEAVLKVNKFFNFNIPMADESKVGNNWMETH